MKLAEYFIECWQCQHETKVILVTKSDDEPLHCSMCGSEAYATLVDAEEDSDI
jgi:transcription elongation factor Elf1